MCDDGSSDLTGETAGRLGAEVIKHDEESRLWGCLVQPLQEGRGISADVVVTLDADGQHDLSYILRLVEPILRGEVDIVVDSRFLSREAGEAMLACRRFVIHVITWLAERASYRGLTNARSGFRAYSRRAVPFVRPSEMGMGASVEILLKAGRAELRIAEIPVRLWYGEGTSTHNPLAHGLDAVLSLMKHYSIRRPLLFYGVPGFLALLASLGF
ncbi:MAG: glycosyltransferase family 2 protein [Candidatus Bathyarchaeia archaeon]